MKERQLNSIRVLGTILLLAVLSFAVFPRPVTGSSAPAFNTFELGRFDVPGVNCPGSIASCWNVNAEPQIRSDPSGNFYASSEYLPRVAICSIALDLLNPQCGGTGAWKSTDNGLHYVTLPSPNTLTAGCSTQFPCTTSFSPFGGDTDLATAPHRNTNGFYNVYVVSLERATGPLLTVEESTSRDGGQTWSINPTSIQAPLNDRPWVAADGSNKVCVSSHNVATGFQILVSCSYDGGITFLQVADVFDASHIQFFTANTQIGNIAIDPNNHVIYQTFASAVVNNAELTITTNFHSIWVAVSIDGGLSFTDYPVFINPDVTVGYDHQFPQVSVDRAGNVYSLFTDDHNTYYSFSADFGKHWSNPVKVNQSPSNTAIFPWSSAGSPGALDVVWYGTSFDGTATPNGCMQQPCTPDNYPSTAAWFVYFAQSLKANTLNPTFSQMAATAIIHYGGVCEAGVTCSGNRDLFDDFGVAASPTTGLASIVFSDDQYHANSATEPPSPTCASSQTNRGPCDHTDIATQVAGPGIFQRDEQEEIEQEDLEQNGSNQPEFDLAVTNTGPLAITSISVQLGGVTLPLKWDTAFPIQPMSIVHGSTVSIPAVLGLIVGGVYQVTVTATLSDGTTVTRNASVIYTLNIGPF